MLSFVLVVFLLPEMGERGTYGILGLMQENDAISFEYFALQLGLETPVIPLPQPAKCPGPKCSKCSSVGGSH